MRAAISEGRRAALAALRRLPAALKPSRAPDRLLFAPRDLRTADPALAQDMLAGLYVFGDRAVERPGQSPFGIAPPSPEWSQDLYGFGWLRHLRAADTAAARELARGLVGQAIAPGSRALRSGVAATPAIAARRIASLLAQSPLLLPGADPVFFRRFLRALARDIALAERAMRDAPVAQDRLAAAVAVCTAGLCCGLERRSRRGSRVLAAELDAQILEDGGHVGRNPGLLLDLLLDLLPLRLLYASRSVGIPPELDRAIGRMGPMLRFFRIGNGDLAPFNGMGRTPIGDLATVLAHEAARGQPRPHAVPSGYDRLEAGSTVVLVEDGPVPPLAASRTAHAGCLSFVMSSGPDALIVNGGNPPQAGAGRDSARATAAHSTLCLGTMSSAAILDPAVARGIGWPARFLARRLGPGLVDGPRTVSSERGLDAGHHIVLAAQHDGYRHVAGAIHGRRLRLSPDGRELEGWDTLTFSAGRAAVPDAALRFHLHPAVRPEVDGSDGSILLRLPSGPRWRFAVVHGSSGPRLAPSAVYAVPEGRRPTSQIVVPVLTGTEGRRVGVSWRLSREPDDAP